MVRGAQVYRMSGYRSLKLLCAFVLSLLWNSSVLAAVERAQTSSGPVLVDLDPVINARSLGVIINTRDPLSVKIGEYYQQQHQIPKENVIRIAFEPGQSVMKKEAFYPLYAQLKAKTPSQVQAYALTWMKPYRVDCQSITSAFAVGFDPAYCATGCKVTRISKYFASYSHKPWDKYAMRPSMLVAARDFHAAKALIDRGVASKGLWPRKAKGYLLKTSDRNRSVRSISDQKLEKINRVPGLSVEVAHQNTLKYGRNVMFYFTGLTHVGDIETNDFLPGAMADHLTSAGGVLDGTGQMSALRWLEGGATGSYGAVVEPCNFTTKFPDPTLAILQYTSGEPLIESYWKSVAMPGQGVFIGDPLASPWGGSKITREGEQVTIRSFELRPGRYQVSAAPSPSGPYKKVAVLRLEGEGVHQISFNDPESRPFYALKRVR